MGTRQQTMPRHKPTIRPLHHPRLQQCRAPQDGRWNVRSRKPIRERFEALFVEEPNSGCWLWIGSQKANGKGRLYYGIFTRATPNWEKVFAHRASYELYIGPIPDGLFVCHRCDVTLCVNPDHLFLGTPLDNVLDCFAKGRFLSACAAALRISPKKPFARRQK